MKVVVGLNDLRKHKFKSIFKNTFNRMCNCGMDITDFFTLFLSNFSYFLNKDIPS